MEQIFDVLIIGGGAGGYTSALYACRAGLDTAVIEKMSAGGQMALTDIVDNYPGFDEGINGFALGMKMKKGAERFGAKTIYAEVLSVDFSEKIKKVKTANKTFLSKAVIIATGANPRKLGLENEQEFTGRGIHYCAHCDGRFYKDKTVVVIGGGNSAAFGSHKATIVTKTTVVFVVLFFALTLGLAKILPTRTTSSIQDLEAAAKSEGQVLESTEEVVSEEKETVSEDWWKDDSAKESVSN